MTPFGWIGYGIAAVVIVAVAAAGPYATLRQLHRLKLMVAWGCPLAFLCLALDLAVR